MKLVSIKDWNEELIYQEMLNIFDSIRNNNLYWEEMDEQINKYKTISRKYYKLVASDTDCKWNYVIYRKIIDKLLKRYVTWVKIMSRVPIIKQARIFK